MSTDDFSFGVLDEKFTDAHAATLYLEGLRWADGVVCPHCGEREREPYLLKGKRRVWKCKACRKQFTVTVGTIFERSHIPLNKWLLAFNLLCSSKKGMSAHQLHRMLGVTYKSAWFMAHRIRYAMTQSPFAKRLDGVVEVDETYIGGKARNRLPRYRGSGNIGRGKDKVPVVALVQRNGQARALALSRVTSDELKGAIRRHVAREARIITDSFPSYRGLHKEFAQHNLINHANDEWVRGDVHTNTVEGYFSILKRGVNGVYHHVSEQHLPRYLTEFDFRYNTRSGNGYTDSQRTRTALMGAEGKRLTYAGTKSS